MNVLVLGADGMLGHALYRQLRAHHKTYGTLRQKRSAYPVGYAGLDPDTIEYEVDARDFRCIASVILGIRPDVVINAIGAIKQRHPSAHDAVAINAMLPHVAAKTCSSIGARFIQVSTDCVFSGLTERSYQESSVSDATDLYGRSKYLGEVTGPNCLTIRTSIIGLEIDGGHGLVEWFLAQHGSCSGYTHARFSGLTTTALARIIEEFISGNVPAEGLWHVASEPITKYDLLCRLDRLLGRDGWIEPDASVGCNRVLDGSRLRRTYPRLAIPSWDSMLRELADDIQARKASE